MTGVYRKGCRGFWEHDAIGKVEEEGIERRR